MESVADRPRMHLGDVVYEPVLKRARLQDPRTGRPPRSGFQSIPKPLPWDLIKGKENCTLTMKIGKEHLVPAAREEITARRALWGTDVYTDDSDVVAACIHAGWIRGEWPEDVDVSMLGLDEGYSVSDVGDLLRANGAGGKGGKSSPSQQSNPSSVTVLTEPPKTGPMPVPENRDLHVTLLILPRLERYASTTRFGIKSREFGGPIGGEDSQQRAVHDGISFMVIGLRWVTNGGASQSRLRGKARRERIRKALEEIAMTPAWISRPVNGGGGASGPGGSNGTDASADREVGLGWWKQNTSSSKPPSEGDKENANRAVATTTTEKEPPPQQTQEEAGKDEKRVDDSDKDNKDSREAPEEKEGPAAQEKEDAQAAVDVNGGEEDKNESGKKEAEKGEAMDVDDSATEPPAKEANTTASGPDNKEAEQAPNADGGVEKEPGDKESGTGKDETAQQSKEEKTKEPEPQNDAQRQEEKAAEE